MVLILVIVSMAPACRSAGEFRGLIKIGLVAPFSGRDYARGYNALYGVKLALKEWNSKGGVNGYRVELVAQDDHNDAAEGQLQAKKMALDPAILGVVGHLSSASALSALPEYRRAEMPVVFTEATADALISGDPAGVARLNLGDQAIAGRMIAYAKERLGVSSVAIIVGSGEEDKAQAACLRGAAELARVPVVLEEELGFEQLEFPEIVNRLLAANPGVVLYVGEFSQGGELARQLKAARLPASILIGPGAATEDFVKIAGLGAAGVDYVSLAPTPEQRVNGKAFIKDYREVSFGREPWPSATLAYDGANLLLSAMERSLSGGKEPARDQVANTLGKMAGTSGPTGTSDQTDPFVGDSGIFIYRLTLKGFPGERQD